MSNRATFYYKASTAAGEVRSGSMAGESERAVVARLRNQGLLPVLVSVAPVNLEVGGSAVPGVIARRGKTAARGKAFWKSRSLTQDRQEFTQELATLLGSGVPLDRALRISTQLSANPRFQAVLADVLRQIQGGKSLADAMQTHPKVFSRLYVNLVRAGQASGALTEVFVRLADHESREAEFRSHIVSSMIYPVLLAGVAAVSMFVMMYVVVPRFGEVFATTGIPMPASTALLMSFADAVRNYGLYLLILGAAAGYMIARWLRTEAGRRRLDRLMVSLPLIGDFVRKAETARLARTMATLVGHGVPIVDALRIAKETLGNSEMSAAFDPIIQGVKRGEGVARPVEQAGVLPTLAVHLLRVGEETGRLDHMFERMATVYDSETRTTLRRVTALFEPAVILVMGLTIGSIVLSLLMAISSINELPL